jgi:hypothetical protein
MDEFVNYKKRDISLPHGCKDLHDVLKIHQAPVVTQRTIVKRDESVTGALSEIGKFVAMVLESRADSIILGVNPPEDRLSVFIGHVEGDPVQLTVHVHFQKNSALETKLLEFIAQRGLKALGNSGMPPSGLPAYFVFEFSPLPSDEPSISELITDFFERVCGARSDTELSFHCVEVVHAVSPIPWLFSPQKPHDAG